ncbi:unnamed protein product [Allacma fusca]|uniref:Brix domain-containing protein n=1 Tax=Allacma fusca TaxID=39272 RepID=A0A8J2K5H9_9HEXA|nr:unnamed protein product [Allacma fusca]
MGKKKTKGRAKRKINHVKNHDPAETTVAVSDEWAQFEPTEYKSAPHSFIIYRGKVGRHIRELMRDFRQIMEPYTASKLQMRKGNVLRDYVAIASYFHVTHLCVLSRTSISPYLKICRIPRGPTLVFRILNYSLARDVLSTLRKQVTYDMQFHHHPLLIMNNFTSEEKHMELISATFQNMFPSININKIRLKEIRRILLLNYNEEDDTIDLRHYTVTYRPVGVSKNMKKLLANNHGKLPNLGRCEDIAEFLNKEAEASESEGEDMSETVDLGQRLSARGTKGVDEVAIRLVELGPRMKLQLIKIEGGLMEGEVLYHKHVLKTDEEKLAMRKLRDEKRNVKERRKKIQQSNVNRKQEEKDKHRQKCLAGMGKTGFKRYSQNEQNDDYDDDAEWYRKEVGEEPEDMQMD